MGTRISIPEPEEGYYSKSIPQIFEGAVIKSINRAVSTAKLDVVNVDNAGQLLSIIFSQTGKLVEMPKCPSYLSTLEGCNNYVKTHPDIVTLLADVHAKHAYAWFCENLATLPPPGSTSSPASIEDRVEYRLLSIRAAIREYLRNGTDLPIWQPQVGSDEIREHIARLKLPAIPTSSQYPSLLLHKLGQPSHDPHLAERVDKLFERGLDKRYLWNTSGSGKTRLLLEGLCRNWGLYFTAQTQPDGIGSSDLEDILNNLQQPTRLTPENRETEPVTDLRMLDQRFLLILYVRVLVFREFLDCVVTMPDRGAEKYKSRWLLLQLAPATLLGMPDIFIELSHMLVSSSSHHLFLSINSERERISTRLRREDLFCVIDQAEIPSDMVSETIGRQPILYYLVEEWTSIFPELMVSGTRAPVRTRSTSLGSSVAKEGPLPPLDVFTDFGAFDSEERQRAYLDRYLPPGFLDTESGKALASRAAYWLHGRYSFTTVWLSRLIQTGFQSPHQVLNHFIDGTANFQPSDMDGIDEGDCQIMLEKPRGFDFSNSKQDPSLLPQMAGRILDFIFDENPKDLGGSNNEKLVEYELSRLGSHKDIIADEPIALLASAHYFTTETSWPLSYFLPQEPSPLYERATGVRFEHFGAYLLALAFKSPRPLSTVFDFVGDNDLQDEIGELVEVHKTGDRLVCNPVDITSDTLPTYTLGRTHLTKTETLSWLQDPGRTVFCFPGKDLGPDLILLLRLSDGRLVRVFVRFKQKSQSTMGVKDTEEAWSATDPHLYTANLGLREESPTSLRDLGSGTDQAGDPGLILRVLVTYPTAPHAETLAHLADTDKGHHRVATVDIASLAKQDLEPHAFQSLKLILVAAVVQKRDKQ